MITRRNSHRITEGGPTEISTLISSHPELNPKFPDAVQFGRDKWGGISIAVFNTLQRHDTMIWLSAADARELAAELVALVGAEA
jgi:hypothetical protein